MLLFVQICASSLVPCMEVPLKKLIMVVLSEIFHTIYLMVLSASDSSHTQTIWIDQNKDSLTKSIRTVVFAPRKCFFSTVAYKSVYI